MLTEGKVKNTIKGAKSKGKPILPPTGITVSKAKQLLLNMKEDGDFNAWWEKQPLSQQNVPAVMTLALKEVAYRGWAGALAHVGQK